MVAFFLPPLATQLTEETSRQMAAALRQKAIATPLCPEPIQTTYVQQGRGDPPLLLLHGFDSSVFEFRRLLPVLAPSFETWAIDLLGFGFTERPSQLTFSPATVKEHLYYTWRTLIGRPVVLVGASMGGAAAIDFALTYPDAVQRLVLLDSAGFAKAPPSGRWLLPLTYMGTEVLRNAWVRDRISQSAYHNPKWASADAACCAALHLACPGWRKALVAFALSGGYNFLADQIAEIPMKTLILWGRSDRILGTADASRFEQALGSIDGDGTPRGTLVWLDECGHVPHLEQPQKTAELIQAFVNQS
jgi:pimeloyl-ACP methyl ester carboxylesterase